MLPQLIEPEDLANHLGDPDLLIVDLCRDEIYAQAHVPGAVHVSPAELMGGIKPAVGKLPSEDRINALLSRIGFSHHKHVVAYDDEGGGWAGRLIWTLDIIGHSNWSYLNGGIIAWSEEQLPMSGDIPEIEPTVVSVEIRREPIAEKDDVLSAIEDDNVLIWDARSAEEHAGTKVVAARGGHVPGAINLDWLDLMDQTRGLRLKENLPGLLASRGFTPDKKLIAHCQTHHRSSLAYLVGRLLDRDIRGYHGSWSEWGNDPDTPVEVS